MSNREEMQRELDEVKQKPIQEIEKSTLINVSDKEMLKIAVANIKQGKAKGFMCWM